jgi:2-polyprenyl-3-methyl-5-hydroxy-6-metoxy-1,4-benzoquinol methylase
MNHTQKTILDVGCGERKKNIPNAVIVGVDKFDFPGVDVVHDLNRFPFPFPDNEFDEIICDDVLEHLDDIIAVMEELWRIGKPGGILKISTPHFSSDNYFTDPTHKHPFSSRSFDFFDSAYADKVHQFYTPARFHIRKKLIGFSEIVASGKKHYLNPYKLLGIQWLVNKFPRVYEKFFAFILPATELYFELQIVKKR